MELWIRSQDKQEFIKVSCVKVISNIVLGSISSINHSIRLGDYETKERALEVLDEIQKVLMPQIIVDTHKFEKVDLLQDTTHIIRPILDDVKIQSATSYVYEMPKE